MNRDIIDWPLPLLRLTTVTWDIDWGGQSTGGDTAGGEQIVLNRFPRFKAALALRFERDGIGEWRSLRYRMQGRKNVVRLRLFDPPTMQSVGPVIDSDWQAWRSGVYIEPRPKLRCRIAASAGSTSLSVDESQLHAPVPVGAHLSYDDWPLAVVGRSGSGAATVLTVAMLRCDIPENGEIDLVPRGVFILDDPTEGAPSYGRQLRIAPTMSLTEWITRT